MHACIYQRNAASYHFSQPANILSHVSYVSLAVLDRKDLMINTID